MIDLLKSYSKRLTNLSGKNRSLLLLKLFSRQFFDIHRVNFLHKEPSFNIISKLIQGKPALLSEEFDSRDADVNLASRELKKLIRSEKFIFDEQGSKDLYIGWPFVRGKFMDGTPVRCALIYIPVDISLTEGKFILSYRKSAGINFNKSFLLAYGHYQNIAIPDELLEFDLTDFDNDMTVFRTSLYQMLKESVLEINFNQENFMDQLHGFEEFKKEDYLKNEKEGQLKLYPEAVLGIFPQSGTNLQPDYQLMIDRNQYDSIDTFFEERTISDDQTGSHSPYFFKAKVSEEKTFTPYKADAYQENAIKAIKQGYSVVVQGPPGTGKSQLICNLVADSIARGKNVLVVSQKRAALDVVFNRLSEKFLGNFIGLVHDFRNDRAALYDKISRQIRMIDEYEHENNSLDLVQLERRFLQLSRRIDQLIEFMEEYKTALFDTSECGMSIKELYLSSNPRDEVVGIRQEYQHFHINVLPEFLIKFRDYISYGSKFNQADYPLRERKSFKGYGINELKILESILLEIPQLYHKIKTGTKEILNHGIEVEEAELIIVRRAKIIEMLNILKDEQIFSYFREMLQVSDKYADPLWLQNTERVLMECYKGEGIEYSLSSEQLGKFQEVLQNVLEARKRITKYFKWKVFSKDKYFLKRVLVANGLKNDKEGIKVLVERIDNRLNLEHNISKLKEIDWLQNIPENLKKIDFQNWFHTQKEALKAKLIFNSLRQFSEFFPATNITYEDLKSKLERLFQLIYEIPERRNIWELYFSKTQISNLLRDPELDEKILQTLRRDFDSLCEFDEIQESVKDYEKTVMDNVIAIAQEASIEEYEKILLNSIYIAWINHIETKYPVLRSVSSRKFKSYEAELQNAVIEKLQISNEILLLKVKERTYEDIEYNRLKNRVTYRDLAHQVNKKRRLWPLRKTIKEFSTELFDLLPVWMASPEAVSALFPMEKSFDLVIFDEASQCFVEQAIPSIYRGKQIAIAGDSKQLRPNDLYQARYEEDIDEDPTLEINSILDLADRHLMSVQLKGHYRSQTLDLIDFSNQKFYDGHLTLLPDKNILNQHQPGIEYINTKGIWEKNQNITEANKVVELLFKLVDDYGQQKSIGIVTFNSRQQDLILDLIDDHCQTKGVQPPPGLFVKNIENVQGDERDIIIFSIAYAPDSSGRMLMQFGSLNAEFGENRLNVAITRAREKIYIISSILPSQLKVDEAKNTGPKLLREYLEYAWMVSAGKYKPAIRTNNNEKNWYLQNKLTKDITSRKLDFTILNEMPFADLTIRQGEKYIGLLNLDDDLYFQSPSVKDAHVYRPLLFRKKNWNIYSISSREYWHEPEQTIESMITFISTRT